MTGRPSNVLRTENVGRCSLCEDASGSLHRVALRFACLWRRSNGPHGLRTIWAGSHVIGVRGLSDPGQLEGKRDELTTLHIGCVPAAGHVVIGPVL